MKKNKAAGGVVLIIVGIVLMLEQLDIINNINMLLIIGCIFLAAYIAFGRNLGFLIPGCIITSIGLFIYFSDKKIISPTDGGALILFFIAAAFWAILFAHTMWIKTGNWGTKYWPIFPAGIITISGLITARQIYYYNTALKLIAGLLIPAALVIAGILIMFSKKHKDLDESGERSIHDDTLK